MTQAISKAGTDPAVFRAMHAAGFTLFPIYGYTKQPHKGFLNTAYEPDWEPEPGNNYGVLLRRRFLVIDVDPRHYPEGRLPFRELMQALGLPEDVYRQTFAVKTPRGGYHIYFSKPAEWAIVGSLKQYPGIEFKDQHIMCPGSYIYQDDKGRAVNGGYTPFCGQPSAIASADPRLLAMIKAVERVPQVLAGEITPDQEADVRWFVGYCRNTPPAVEGQNGDRTAFNVAREGRARGLSRERVFEIMRDQFNPRCVPPDEDWIQQKVNSAFEYSQDPAGVRSVQNDFDTLVTGETKTVRVPYQRTPSGGLKKSFANLVYFMEYPIILSDRDGRMVKPDVPVLAGSLKFDAFANRLRWAKPAPWVKTVAEWDDQDAIQYMARVSKELELDFQKPHIHDAAYTVAAKQTFHPVRDYLDSLVWDKTPRLDTWLTRYCEAADNRYIRFVARKTLVAAVARVFAPGCKFDHVLVMEGRQGQGKSYFWELMASPWFSDAPLNINDKQAVETMSGKWIIELGEMENISKYESAANKRFLTASTDRCRVAWGLMAKDYPRQCIFVGGINPELHGWLRDLTGNRRYWPVPVGRIDLKAVKRDRDQLWAEALVCFRSGETIHVDDESMRHLMEQEVEARLQEDPWFGIIEAWLADEKNLDGHIQIDGLTIHLAPVDVYVKAIGGGAAAFGTRELGRILVALNRLGFERKRDGVNKAYYYARKLTRAL